MQMGCKGCKNWFSPLVMQMALFCITCCLPSSCRPRCALVWGMVVRGFARQDLC